MDYSNAKYSSGDTRIRALRTPAQIGTAFWFRTCVLYEADVPPERCTSRLSVSMSAKFPLVRILDDPSGS